MARSRIAVLTPVRNGAEDLPDFFTSVGRFADLVVALDDGSTDLTGDLLRANPIVAEVLTNPTRATYAGWDDAGNRRRLLEAVSGHDADWILFLDADERIDAADSSALRELIDSDAIPGFAFGFQVFRMIESPDEEAKYDTSSGLWVYRMFAYEPDLELPDRRLHFVPIPTSIPRSRWLRTTVRIQHVGSFTESRRSARFQKYREADPDTAYQDSYANLLRPPRSVARWHERSAGQPALLDQETELSAVDPDVEFSRTPAISAVVIAQNDEATIAQSVQALVEQVVAAEFEVIVVTSGSDATADTVRTRFPSVRLIELPRPVLPGEARNVGLWVARGGYITFPGSHVRVAPGYLQARLDAHDAGWELVTGTTLNGNETRAGWASYFLDHSSVLPDRESGEIGAAPAHCSYVRSDLDRIGGFPEDMRAGEDTVVNQELFSQGRRSYREQRAAITHSSRSRTAVQMLRHHFVRGRAWGRIVRSRSESRRELIQRRGGVLLLMPFRRYRTVSRNVALWGNGLRKTFKAVRVLVALGAFSAALGTWYQILRGLPEGSGGSERQFEQMSHSTPAAQRQLLAHYGSPKSTKLGILGFGSPDRAAKRLSRVTGRYPESVLPALYLLGTAATAMPGPDGSHTATLRDRDFSAYLAAARHIGGLLILSIQPGWSSVQDAVMRHRSLIGEPDVAIALEPGWRTDPPHLPGTAPGRWDPDEMEIALRIFTEVKAPGATSLALIHSTPDVPWPSDWTPPDLPGLEVIPIVDMVAGPEEKLEAVERAEKTWGHAGVVWNYRRDPEILQPDGALGHSTRPRVIVYR